LSQFNSPVHERRFPEKKICRLDLGRFYEHEKELKIQRRFAPIRGGGISGIGTEVKMGTSDGYFVVDFFRKCAEVVNGDNKI